MQLIKLGGAVLNQTPFDWDNNKQNIVSAIEQARRENVSVLCLPELCLTGYGCEDDFFRADLHKKSWTILKELAALTEGMIVAVGLPVLYGNSLFNCAALLVDGKIAGLVAKKNLAGDGIHYEPRWFEAWQEDVVVNADICGERVPLGDIHFNIGGVKFGFEICEEAWVGQRPSGKLSARAVDIILNPSASHFSFAKFETRKRLVLEGSRAFGGTYVFTNLVGNEAGRAIYDGGVIIAQSGNLLALGSRFSFMDCQLTTAIVDVELTRMRQARTFSFTPDLAHVDTDCVHVDFQFPKLNCPSEFSQLSHSVWENGQYLKEEEFTRAVTLGLFDYLRKSRSSAYVVSLSGGADSTAVSCLVALMVSFAIRELDFNGFLSKLAYVPELSKCQTERDLVSKLLICAYQSTKNSGAVTRNAAKAVAEALSATFFEMDVDPILEMYGQLAEKALGRKLSWEKDDVAMQNIQARVRSPGIWYLANLFGGILLCTSNRSEGAVGYCTMDGDTSGGLSPIAGVDKHFLRSWLNWLEHEGPSGLQPIPGLSVVNKQAPTAELRPPAMTQTDEKDLMPYDLLEAIEDAAIEDNRSPAECYELVRASEKFSVHSDKQLATWVERFFRLWSINQWKRERLAPALHVDSHNLDPRTWRRSPILSGAFKREIAEMWAKVNQNQVEKPADNGRKKEAPTITPQKK